MTKQPLSIRRLAPLALLGVGLGLTSCENLLTESPPHIIVADNLYRDAAGFDAGLSGLYAIVRQEHEPIVGTGQMWNTTWYVGTDVVYGDDNGISRVFNEWGAEINPTTSYFQTQWTWLYEIINTANTIIGRADEPEADLTEEQRNTFVAEARFFRAYAYRHLTYLWGDVPLNLEESSGESVRTDWERTPVAEVRQQMEQDLLFAEQHLPTVPPTAARITSAVAQHYLAELYLATGENAKAEEKARAVVDSDQYGLITERYGVNSSEPGVPFMDMFQPGNINRQNGNSEILWAFQFEKDAVGGGRPIMRRVWLAWYSLLPGVEITVETGGRGIQRHKATRWALHNYEPQDHRGSYHGIRWFLLMNDASSLPEGAQLGDTVWLSTADGERVGRSADWPWPRKYEWADPTNLTGNYDWHPHTKLRLAETYLLLAEAQFKQGKLGEAAENINRIRGRSNASLITSGEVTLEFILDERARELQQEEERRYTLLRTGTWLERTRKYNPIAGPKIQEHNVLLPIPQGVIDANLDRDMQQNPGY